MHKLLQNAIETGRTGVSWLIYADNEARVAREADAYLLALFCDNGTGCGTCPGCRKAATRQHADLMHVEGAKVDDVRGLAAFVARHSFEGGVKVIYIPRVDALNEQAQNALLKTLEEPQQDTVLVLGAVNTDAVLPTILSRCTMLEASPDSERAAERVAEDADVPLPQADVLVRAAHGDYDGAMRLHEQGFLKVREGAVEGARRILHAKNRATSRIERMLLPGDGNLELSLQIAILYLEDVLREKYRADPEHLVNMDLRLQAAEDARVPVRVITAALTGMHALLERMHACKGIAQRLALQGSLLGILEDVL